MTLNSPVPDNCVCAALEFSLMRLRPKTVILIVALMLALAVPCYVWLRDVPEMENIPASIHTNVMVAPATNTNPLASVDHFEGRGRAREQIFGIGAILKTDKDSGTLMINGVVPNSPAAEAGLAGNFLIRKIDAIVTDGMKLQECVELIRGPAGSTVRLELFDLDANESRTVELTRRKIQLLNDRERLK
jgi:hypothetical protein